MNRKLLVLPLAGAVLLAAAAWAWQSRRESGAERALTLYGNVDIRQVSLAFDGSERIAELRARRATTCRRATCSACSTRALRAPAGAGRGADRRAAAGPCCGCATAPGPRKSPRRAPRWPRRRPMRAWRARSSRGCRPPARDRRGRGVSEQDLDSATTQPRRWPARAWRTKRAGAAAAEHRAARARTSRRPSAAGRVAQAAAGAAAAADRRIANCSAPGRRAWCGRGCSSRATWPRRSGRSSRWRSPAPKWVRAYVSETRPRPGPPGMPRTSATDSHPGAALRGQGRLHLLDGGVHAQVGADARSCARAWSTRCACFVDDPRRRAASRQPATVRTLSTAAQ